jgi:hypothetical protein
MILHKIFITLILSEMESVANGIIPCWMYLLSCKPSIALILHCTCRFRSFTWIKFGENICKPPGNEGALHPTLELPRYSWHTIAELRKYNAQNWGSGALGKTWQIML